MTDKGLRYNEGKIRYELVPDSMIKGVADVLTYGADKYTVRDEEGEIIVNGANNWKKGLSWMGVKASHDRHMAAWVNGEDVDPESGKLHIDLALTNLAFLKEYYKTYPQGDDRPHRYLNPPKIALDIDEVIAHWIKAYKAKYGYKEDHEFISWHLNYKIEDRCRRELDEAFYRNLEPKIDPKSLKFEPYCYITSRREDLLNVTKEWIYRNGFPCKPVYIVNPGDSKVAAAKHIGIDIMVDDVYKNFLELNQGGICCYLFDAPHNRRFDVGHKRIKNLNELA